MRGILEKSRVFSSQKQGIKYLFLIKIFIFLSISAYGNSANIAKLQGNGEKAYTMSVVDNLVVFTYPYLTIKHTENEITEILVKSICSDTATKTDIQNGYKYMFIYTGNKQEVTTAVVNECN